MEKIADLVKEYLFEEEALTIPELGTFLTRYESAEVLNQQQVKPPQNQVVFSEHPKTNDGKFTQFVMSHLQVSEESAEAYIKDFVDRIKHEVRYNKLYNFENVGVFSLTKDRRLQFSSAGQINFLGESFGLEEITNLPKAVAPPVVENIPYVEKEIQETTPQQEEEVVHEAIQTPVYQPVIEENKEEIHPEYSNNFVVEEPHYETYPVQEAEENEVIEEPIVNPTEEYLEETPRRNWLKPTLIGLAAGAALIAGGLYFFDKGIYGLNSLTDEKSVALQDTTLQSSLPNDTLGFGSFGTDSTVKPIIDTINLAQNTKKIVEKIVQETPKVIPKVEPKLDEKPSKSEGFDEPKSELNGTISQDASRYYVIAGGFSNETNANVLKKQLQKIGLNDIKFLTPYGDEKLIKVSAADYANGNEAFAKAKELSENFKGVWVLTPKKK